MLENLLQYIWKTTVMVAKFNRILADWVEKQIIDVTLMSFLQATILVIWGGRFKCVRTIVCCPIFAMLECKKYTHQQTLNIVAANICRGYESDRSARYSSSFNSCNSINDEVEPISYKSSRMALEDHLNFTTQKSRDITEGARQVEGNMTPLSSQRSKAKDSSVIVIHDSVSESICDVTGKCLQPGLIKLNYWKVKCKDYEKTIFDLFKC